MTFLEFIEQVIFIVKNLSLSFWVSVIIISPLFMWFGMEPKYVGIFDKMIMNYEIGFSGPDVE